MICEWKYGDSRKIWNQAIEMRDESNKNWERDNLRRHGSNEQSRIKERHTAGISQGESVRVMNKSLLTQVLQVEP